MNKYKLIHKYNKNKAYIEILSHNYLTHRLPKSFRDGAQAFISILASETFRARLSSCNEK